MPEATRVFDVSRWHDPERDTEHLGLSRNVFRLLWQDRETEILQMVRQMAFDVATAAAGASLTYLVVCRRALHLTSYVRTYVGAYVRT